MTGRIKYSRLWFVCLALFTSLAGCSNRPANPAASGEELYHTLQLLALMQDQGDRRFHDLLQSISETFTEVAVTGEEDELSWTTVTLNASGTNFDAVRFRSPLSVPADMRWAFSAPKDQCEQWYICPARGRMRGFADYTSEDDLDLDGVDLAEDNTVFFQALDGGHVKPGEEYVIWFSFDHRDPVELNLAIRLVKQGRLAESKTSEALARDLGIAVPFQHRYSKAVTELLKEVKLSYWNRDLEGALRLAERARQVQPSHRQTLLFLASLHIARGRQLLEAQRIIDDVDPRANFLVAAVHSRLLQQTYKDLNDHETAVLHKSLYLAAETHSLSGKGDKALSVLREALDAGFDARHVDTRNFSSLKKTPEFLQMIQHQAAVEPSTVNE